MGQDLSWLMPGYDLINLTRARTEPIFFSPISPWGTVRPRESMTVQHLTLIVIFVSGAISVPQPAGAGGVGGPLSGSRNLVLTGCQPSRRGVVAEFLKYPARLQWRVGQPSPDCGCGPMCCRHNLDVYPSSYSLVHMLFSFAPGSTIISSAHSRHLLTVT